MLGRRCSYAWSRATCRSEVSSFISLSARKKRGGRSHLGAYFVTPCRARYWAGNKRASPLLAVRPLNNRLIWLSWGTQAFTFWLAQQTAAAVVVVVVVRA